MKHNAWLVCSGLLWLAIGVFLLNKGVHLIADALLTTDSLSFRFQHLFGGQQYAAASFIAVGLLLGWIKGRTVLAKTVKRIAGRIASLSLPIRFRDVYAPSYWGLIGAMIALGVCMRFLPIPLDARGLIDVAIGSALINGAMLYFRFARA